MHGEVILPICFPPFSQLSAFAYIYIFLFDLFVFACLSAFTQVGPSVPKIFRDDFFSRQWDHLCPRYLEMIFFTRMGPSVPEIIGVMFHPSGTICAQDI